MIILHVSVSDGRLLLWGETSGGSAGKASRKGARRVEPARPPRSRFALEGARIVEIAAVDVPEFDPSKEQSQRWVAWLPSNPQGALPSSPLLTENGDGQGTVSLAPWGPGLVLGKTLAYWATVLRFAGSLVARQQYLASAGFPSGRERRRFWTR